LPLAAGLQAPSMKRFTFGYIMHLPKWAALPGAS
jgi:hypothetical protein